MVRRAWVLALLVAAGCADKKNRAPSLFEVADQDCRANAECGFDVRASDPDGDALSFTCDFDAPGPPTQAGGCNRLALLEPGHARFSWTPGIGDAGDGLATYRMTLRVSDGRGKRDDARITIRVSSEEPGDRAPILFTDPPGAGMAVQPDPQPCVHDLRVAVKADAIPGDQIVIELGAPAPEGATLSPGRDAKERLFNWCPTDEQLDQSLTQNVAFVAHRVGDTESVTKRFLIRFKRNADAGCPGAPPMVEHVPPGTLTGPLNYEIHATVTDDVGFKSPPVLVFSDAPDALPPDGSAPDTSGWQLVDFQRGQGDDWVATIPNRGLAPGEERQVHYVIIATDDDDPQGTRCDHTTESPPFTFVARGGDTEGGATYGFCASCVSDDQCGGPDDLCVNLRGESFCTTACHDADCDIGQVCVQVQSVGGVSAYQCVPGDLNCGQLCAADDYDAQAPNDAPEHATRLDPGTYEHLSICDQDLDFYAVDVQARQSIRVTARFDHTRGDLDLAMQLPGDDDFVYQSLLGDSDEETVYEPCTVAAGPALLAVFPYQGARNTYDLHVEVGPGECDRACHDDMLEQAGNDAIDHSTPVDRFPYERDGLQICPQNADFFGFQARAGEFLRVGIAFRHADGDLQLRLLREGGGVLAESLSFRDAELIEGPIPVDGTYVAEVFGATRSVANAYDLLIDKMPVQACAATHDCPPGEYCRDGSCRAAVCDAADACGQGHRCVPPRAGLAPEAVGGECVDACRGDADCRQANGYTCKRFEDFTPACAPAGAAGPGERCRDYADCAADAVCLNLPGGYCAAGGCDTDVPCPDGTACVDLGGLTACLKACAGDGDCRVGEGYGCQDLGGAHVCLPCQGGGCE